MHVARCADGGGPAAVMQAVAALADAVAALGDAVEGGVGELNAVG